MVKMKQGFYMKGRCIYYGEFPEDHVSGSVRISAVRPENLKTDRPFTDRDVAVKLFDNHGMTEQEMIDFAECSALILQVLKADAGTSSLNLQEVEQRLGVVLPQEIWLLYSVLLQGSLWSDHFTDGTSRFLGPEELYLDGEHLVFYQVKKTPVALSLTEGTKKRYHKNEWVFDRGDENFFCYALDRLAVHAISQMPLIRQGKVKGKLKTAINPKDLLAGIYGYQLKVIEQYHNYGNVLLYHEDGALAWFRQNGFAGDILLGASDEQLRQAIVDIESEILWE